MSHLGDLFHARRVERGVTVGQLARQVGYRNVSKGCNRLRTFEVGGEVAPDLLSKLATALEVNPGEIRLAIGEDYREWLDWANEPVRPHLVLRYMACVYQ